MKYSTTFKNKHGDEFSVSSMDDYEMSEKDLSDFTHVLSDDPVRNYITDEAMNRWGHATPESLAEDILSHSRVRWEESKELRFLMRDKEGKLGLKYFKQLYERKIMLFVKCQILNNNKNSS